MYASTKLDEASSPNKLPLVTTNNSFKSNPQDRQPFVEDKSLIINKNGKQLNFSITSSQPHQQHQQQLKESSEAIIVNYQNRQGSSKMATRHEEVNLSDDDENNSSGGEDHRQYQAACIIQKYYRRYKQVKNYFILFFNIKNTISISKQ